MRIALSGLKSGNLVAFRGDTLRFFERRGARFLFGLPGKNPPSLGPFFFVFTRREIVRYGGLTLIA